MARDIALAMTRTANVKNGLKRMNAKGQPVYTGKPMEPATRSVPHTKAPMAKKTVVSVSYFGGEPKTAVKRY